MQYKNYTPNYEIVAPKGISESLANLKNCLPNGKNASPANPKHCTPIGIPTSKFRSFVIALSQQLRFVALTGNTLTLYDTMYRLLQLFLQIFISKSFLFL